MKQNTSRQDLFTVVHKAIRAFLYDIGTELQRSDLTDAQQAKPFLTSLADRLEMIREHARHEDRFIFSELRAYEPAMVDAFEAEHVAVESKVDAVAEAMEALRFEADSSNADRLALDRTFNDFLAAYLIHMNAEETTLLPATWEHFDDVKIGAIRTNIQQAIDPPRYEEWLRWIFAAQTTEELTTLFRGVKKSAPPAILAQMTERARSSLGETRWGAVATNAGL